MEFQITYQLPFYIPISGDKFFVSGYTFDEKETIYKLSFKSDKVNVCFPWNKTEEIKKITFATVEMDFLYIQSDNKITESLIKMVFKRGLWYLNHFIDALRLTVETSKIHNITVAHLPKIIEIFVENKNVYPYLTFNVDDFSDDNEIPSKVCNEITGKLKQLDMFPDTMLVETFFQNAKTYLKQDLFPYAVIEFQTSFELFLRNSYRYILNQKSTPLEKVEKQVAIRNLKTIITEKLGRLFRVDLSYEKPGPMKEWNENLYTLRNNIVHKGQFNISREQALKAQDAYINARNFIVDCMVSRGFINSDRKVKLTGFRPSVANKELEEKLNKSLMESKYIPKDRPLKLLGIEEDK